MPSGQEPEELTLMRESMARAVKQLERETRVNRAVENMKKIELKMQRLELDMTAAVVELQTATNILFNSPDRARLG